MTQFIAFDLETTGLDPKNDAIIEVALVRFDETGILERWSTLVNPGFSLPTETTTITGITDADLADAPFFSDVRTKIVEFCTEGVPLVGHNIDFDLSFFREYGMDIGTRPIYDTFRLSEFLFFREKSLNLGSLLESFGFPFEDQHRALSDTEATVQLFLHCLSTMRAKTEEDRSIFSYAYRIAAHDTSIRHLFEYLGYTDAAVSSEGIRRLILSRRSEHAELAFLKQDDIEVKWEDILMTPLSSEGGGSGVRQMCDEGLTPPSQGGMKEDSSSQVEDQYVLSSQFSVLSSQLEERPEQAKMLSLVTEAFAEKELRLIEAPTGIGKTFAYGVPGILHSIRMGHQVFISTNTKTLQDQIFEKDVPALHTLFARQGLGDFSVAKIKGRSNYVSLLLFFEYMESGALDEPGVIFFLKIAFWLTETRYGETDEIVFYGGEYDLLDRIRATDRRVLALENPYRKEEFLYRIRQDAKNANVVIMNHSLLLSEIETSDETRILPAIRYLVIDEAHNLESVATDALREEVTLALVESALESLDLIIKKQKRVPGTDPFIFGEFRNISESIVLNFGMLLDVFSRYLAHTLPSPGDMRYNQTLIEQNFFRQEGVEGARRILATLHDRLHDLISGLFRAPEALYAHMERHIDTLERSLSVMDRLFCDTDTDHIKIVSENATETTVAVVPLHVGKRLSEGLFSKLDACVATSATLSVNGDFSFIEKSLSMQAFSKHVLASDFDYSRQALVFIPSDIGDIRSEADRASINGFISDMIRIVGGRTLGLFTSFSSIKETYLQIHSDLKSAGVTLMTQWLSWGRARMIEYFKKNSASSALFGTDSFWEWVDIPGRDLELLIIYKFPFAVPTDPIFRARSRLYRDSFEEYSLPAMILKLRQGLGRLIRTKTDRGIIVLLDSRISSAWGERVRAGFPEGVKIRTGKREDFLQMLQKKKM